MKLNEKQANVVESVIKAMESVEPGMNFKWSKGVGMPRNGVTGHRYQGINVVLLWHAAHRKNYTNPYWCTYDQALKAGGHVKKDEKGTHIFVVKPWSKVDKRSGEEKSGMFYGLHSVFNLDQVEGVEVKEWEKLKEHGCLEDIDVVLDKLGADVIHGGDKACYIPSVDRILMPMKGQFELMEGYYSVKLHEYMHWTGAEKRLNRDFSGRFGEEAYAFEELVAEIGNAMLMAHFGLEEISIPGHAKYLKSWIRVLKNDQSALLKAASLASRGVAMILGTTEESESSEDESDQVAA
jgi:antirestriction protein ArdC